MVLSDICIRRPVLATVISAVLVIFGLFAFQRLPVREYPNIDPPVVSISTIYKGASAQVIETQVTQILENAIAGIEGIKTIQSTSREESSKINVEFQLSRDIESAAADVRDKVSRAIKNLPDEIDPPIIQKADADDAPILSLSVSSNTINAMEMTDYAHRVLIDRFSTLPGVANIRIFGERLYSMRIWLDKTALAARGLTVSDVEQALRRENVELPSGRIESQAREFTVRTESGMRQPAQFGAIVVGDRKAPYLVRLRDVAFVERNSADLRSMARTNGVAGIGVGIIKQSTANTLEVADAVKQELERLRPTLPEGMDIAVSYDESLFISRSIYEVFHALFTALVLVIAVTFLFLRNIRATIIPTVAIPVSIIASFTVLAAAGYSINVLTLLALVLAIGLVVDDAIVVLENVHRRIEEGEPVLLAAVRGSRQIGFAVIATTLVLVAVFVPIAFLQGNVGRLFAEFAMATAFAVMFSGLVALTLTPMMCSKWLKPSTEETRLFRLTEPIFERINNGYERVLGWSLARPKTIIGIAVAVSALAYVLFINVNKEFAPAQDRGSFTISLKGPEGASVGYMADAVNEIEKELMKLVDGGYADRIFSAVPASFGSSAQVNEGRISVRLKRWEDRDKTAQQIIRTLTPKLRDNPWLQAVALNPPGLGQRGTKTPVQFVIASSTYEELVQLRDRILREAENNPNLINLTSDYDERKPQLMVDIDRNRAADLGVSVRDIGETLQTLLGSKKVTTYTDRGEQYDVILQARDQDRVTPSDLSNVFVRSAKNELIPLANLVTLRDFAGPGVLNRVDRMRAITLQAALAPGYTLGEALDYLEAIAKRELPTYARVSYLGESRDYKESSLSLYLTFGFALIVVFLVLAAQFESFVNPLVILLSVPLAVTGALASLYVMDISLNVYSQIGMVLLIGLVAKNGILIVEFSNQLRAAGADAREAVYKASLARLRPILMTSLATAIGAVPLAFAHGAGAESRRAIGIVVVGGVTFSTALTLVVVPVFYLVFSARTKPTSHIAEAISRLEREDMARGHATAAE
ncbi:MAG TPA: efflux RND transporter permease subunit [Alphaproteobacteria bacterium]|jgi:multidrug efflux pump|nr:efflux RND transporter permease subunit [Alphaproteobacteria bacterium]